MPNHYHLLLETPRANLRRILHHLNTSYTNYFNAKTERVGHLFQGRYRAILVEKDAYCQELSRYIHLNPLRGGMVRDLTRYPWTSYRYYIGLKKKPSWLETGDILGYFGQEGLRAQRKYRGYVEEAIGVELKDPLATVFASTFLGSQEFIKQVGQSIKILKDSDTRNIPVLKALIERPSLEEIEMGVGDVVGPKDPLFKKFCIHISHRYGGFSLKEIGRFYDMKESAVSQASRRFKRAIMKEPSLRNLLRQIVTKLNLLNVET